MILIERRSGGVVTVGKNTRCVVEEILRLHRFTVTNSVVNRCGFFRFFFPTLRYFICEMKRCLSMFNWRIHDTTDFMRGLEEMVFHGFHIRIKKKTTISLPLKKYNLAKAHSSTEPLDQNKPHNSIVHIQQLLSGH